MKRGMVLGMLLAVGALAAVKAQPPAAERAEGHRSREGQGQPVRAARRERRRQHRRVRHRQRRHRRRREEPRLGQTDPRQDQGADAQAGDNAHQYAHARRPCERQRGFPGDGRHRRPGEHQDQHGEDADLQGTQRRRHGQANVQGQDDDRQGRRSDRPVLLRPRPHERRRDRSSSPRCVPRIPATLSKARRSRSSTATTAAACSTYAETLDRVHDGDQERRHDHQRPHADADDMGGPEGRLRSSTATSACGRRQD